MAKRQALKGYKARDSGTHRRYNWHASIRRYKRTGKFTYRGNGSGHKAGEEWGTRKNIDPNSPVRKYSKNSPSFDEGVYKSKQDRKRKALLNKKEEHES